MWKTQNLWRCRKLLALRACNHVCLHLFSSFPIPDSAVQESEKLQRDFLMKRMEEEFKCKLVTWGEQCTPFDKDA